MLPSMPSKHSSQGGEMATSPRIDSSDYRTELLLPPPPGEDVPVTSVPSWRLNKNEIVRVHAQDHFFDVVTNSSGLVTAVSPLRYYWWIDPPGAIIVSFFFSRGFLQFFIEASWFSH